MLEKIVCEASIGGVDAINFLKALVKDGQVLFDVILTDYSMPEMNGAETAVKIREIYRGANIP